MAIKITDECINCGACEDECPNQAIREDKDHEKRVVDPDRCTECVGYFDHTACQEICPSECCKPDPDRPETEAALIDRARKLWPQKNFGDAYPSRFRKEKP